ncbi:MAG: DUF1501 domain-containing protein [Candidatus Omnitrophica bacterium]|nr:DUF1501 domain-containing protein [Candidatus Omnitrophota bacterium]
MNPLGYLSKNSDDKRTLVVVFLRGGADALNMVAPVEDDGYYNARPLIGISKSEAIVLDDLFGLNPEMKALHPLYAEGLLSFYHGAGSEDQTRSHFEAQDLMEHGGEVAGGWLGRFLRYRPEPATGSLSAIAIGKSLPESLRGAPAATVMESFRDFSLGDDAMGLVNGIEKLYGLEEGAMASSAADTLASIKRIESIRKSDYHPSDGAKYPQNEFGEGLMRIARLIRAHVGLEAACIDLGGWDSHLTQGPIMNPRMRALSEGLAAFAKDLGPMMATTSVVVMSEFGRRVRENSALGTDHGRGGLMMVLGGGEEGGRVNADWRGLTDEVLEGPGDLPVTTHYSKVLAPVLRRHGAGEDLSVIFPARESVAVG